MDAPVDTGSAEFRAWFGDSTVVDADGAPLLVFRGEYGRPDGAAPQSRLGSISFADCASAAHYAEEPNQRGDEVHESRIMPAYLKIERPFMVSPDDPYLEMSDVIAGLGAAEATRIALKFEFWIRYTDNWARIEEELGRRTSVADFLDRHPERLSDLYFLAYPYLDDPAETARLVVAGFDGAVHAGSSVTAQKAEYKVFSAENVLPAAPRWLTPREARRFAEELGPAGPGALRFSPAYPQG